MLDLHTHILPNMDDGSNSVKESIDMLQKEVKYEIGRIVLTPHFYANRESPQRFLERRKAAYHKLTQAMEGKEDIPELLLGAEVAYFGGMSRAEDIEALRIGNTRAILVEMPFCKWNRSMIDELMFLKDYRGIRPILAHVERYMGYQSNGLIDELSESGIWMQVNASYFIKWQTAWRAMRRLKNKKIQFIGSDCHDTKQRPPNMIDAMDNIELRLGEDIVGYLERMERRLLEGE